MKIKKTLIFIFVLTLICSNTSYVQASHWREGHDTCLVSDCDNYKSGLSNYCSTHKCSISGCDSSKVGDGSYCSFHQKRLNKSSGKNGTNSSEKATCNHSGCDEKVSSSKSVYCSKHTCSKAKCYNYKKEDATYCGAHK